MRYICFYFITVIISFITSSIMFYDIQIMNSYLIAKMYYNDTGEYSVYILLNSYEFYNKILLVIYSNISQIQLNSILLWITIAKNLELKSLTEESIQIYYSLYIYICDYDMASLLNFIKNKISKLK